MKLGIVPKYLRLYGLEAGAARLRAHGYDGIDYQGFVDTQTDFFNLPEDEFRARLEYERDVLEREGIVIHQSHGPWRYPPIDATPQDRAERFAAMSKAIRGRVKIMIGGAPVCEEFCKQIGADRYTVDAANAADAAVELCKG